MDANTARMFLLFYHLSDLQKHTAEELSDRLEVSKRTVNNDVRSLENFASYHGARLVSDREGYSLQVLDQDEFSRTKDMAMHALIFNPVIGGHVESTGRPFDILRILISSEERMTLDDVADSLFVSKESFKKDYKKARSILSSYGLQYNAYNRNQKNIIGSEFNLRMCMLYLYHSMHMMTAQDMFSDGLVTFYESMQADPVIDAMRDTLIREELTEDTCIRRSDAGRVRGYLNLSENRLKKGYHFSYEEEDKVFLRSFGMYQVAKKLTEKSLEMAGLPMEEEEVFGLEQFLLMYEDIDSDTYRKEDYYPICQEAENLTLELSEYIEEYFGVCLLTIPAYRKQMTCLLIPLLIQIHFQAAGFYWNYLKIGDMEKYGDPLGNAMGLAVKNYIRQKYSIRISRHNISLISRGISNVLSGIDFQDSVKKIVVYSSFGKETAKAIARTVEKVLPNHLQYEWYLMKEQGEVGMADLAIVQSRNQAWYPTKKIIYVDLIPSVMQLLEISSFFIRKQTGPQMFYSIFHREPVIVRDYVYPGKTEFIEHMVSKLNSGMAEQEKELKMQKQKEYLVNCDFFVCYNGVCVLFVEKDFFDSPVFLAYVLKNPENARWHGRHINSIFIVQADLDGSLDYVKYLRDFMQVLTSDKELLRKFLDTGDPAAADSQIVTV